MNPMLTRSGKELAGLIRKRERSSREVVESHIEQIREVNPVINAVVRDRFDQALREAEAADEMTARVPAADLPPFHGVPCTIKEAFRLSGMPHTSGLVARGERVANDDATAVDRMRRAGAIPLGVTNVSELCMWMESNNKVYGRTCNPYNPERTVGGSSGGEGAVIAAGGSPFGLGSDVGGSIRMPAFFNGVFGHKPTGGLVPNTGQYPLPENEVERYCTSGPLARRAEDLMPLLGILAGPDGIEAGCLSLELGKPEDVNLRGMNVYVPEIRGTPAVSGELLQVREDAAAFLGRQGAHVQAVSLKSLGRSMEIWSSMMGAAEGKSFRELMGNGKPFHSSWELARWFTGRSPHTLPGIVLTIMERISGLVPSMAGKFVEQGRQLREELSGLLGPDGVFLYPPYTSAAPKHNKPLWPPFNWVYTAILNVMELPVTQVPMGLDREGLPLGVQVAGNHGRDHVTIAVALALEKEFGGWVPPDSLT